MRCAQGVLLFLAASLVLPLSAAAQDEERGETSFPLAPWHARVVALGGAGAAIEGLEFLRLNPAAGAGQRGGHVSRRSSAVGAEDYDLALAHGGRWGTVVLHVRQRDWGEIAGDLGLDDLRATEQAGGLSYALSTAGGRVGLGVSLLRLEADYLGARSSGWALDLGGRLVAGRGISLGVALLRASRGLAGPHGRSPLPTRARTGLAWQGEVVSRTKVVVLADAAMPLAWEAPEVSAGVELAHTVGPVTGLGRAGWHGWPSRPAVGGGHVWGAGGGIAFGALRADIGYILGGVLGNETSLSLSLRW